MDSDDAISTLELKETELRSHKNNNHSAYGNGILVYNYNFVLDGDNYCSPNPCQNGDVCVDGCASYTYQCPSNHTGTNCEHFSGNLRFRVCYAHNLSYQSHGTMIVIHTWKLLQLMEKETRSLNIHHTFKAIPIWNGTKGCILERALSWKLFKVHVYAYDIDYCSSDATRTPGVWFMDLMPTRPSILLRQWLFSI